MTRFEYIYALRQALSGLPPDVIAATVAEYERRIRDASAAGQSEDDIMASLGDPQKVAAERRAGPRFAPVKQQTRPVSFVRMFCSFIGLMVVNLFLVIPAIVYASILLACFVVSLACYAGGIAMTGAALAGVDDISFDHPDHVVFLGRPLSIDDKNSRAGAAASTSTTDPGSLQIADGKSMVKIGPNGVRVSDGSSEVRVGEAGDGLDITENKHGVDVHLPGLHIHNPEHRRNFFLNTGDVSESRPIQVSIGIGLILAGIVAFLLCLAIAKFTLIGILRLVQTEFSILKNA